MPGNYATADDGGLIFYQDWGPREAQPIVFHHGWPLSSDDWEAQMRFFFDHGYRVIAHDRRGHGRSPQAGQVHDVDRHAADAATVSTLLDLRDAVHVGHGTGGGEVARYVARYGQPQGRVAKAVLIGAMTAPPASHARRTSRLPARLLEGIRAGLAGDRAQLFVELASGPFYGFNRPGTQIQPGIVGHWIRQALMGSAQAQHDGLLAFSEADHGADLEAIDVPVLVMHGDDDQVVPLAGAALRAVSLLRHGTLQVYAGAPHGLHTTHADAVNQDLLAFIRA